MMEMRSVGAIFPGRISISIMGFLTQPLPATRPNGSRLSMAISGLLAVSQISQRAAERVVHKGRGHQFFMPIVSHFGKSKKKKKKAKWKKQRITETERKSHFIVNMTHIHFSSTFRRQIAWTSSFLIMEILSASLTNEKALRPVESHGKKTTFHLSL